MQIILEKYFIKNCKRQNKAFFARFAAGAFAPYICPQNSVLNMYTRACVRALRRDRNKGKKIVAKKFSQKSCKKIWSIKINAYLCTIETKPNK